MAKVAHIIPDMIGNIHISGESKCVIGALDKVATSFNQYMHCRLTDIHHLLGTMQNFANFRPLKHIPSKENVVDLATSSETSLSSIWPGLLRYS